ncbi:MAG: methyltransferase domain-containing protein [Fervidobacterium sp.]|jgi:DNA modification methylase|uniref:Methyltransferase n=2 Tax=Fervidobacterium pennivorans TaxID=93466 RepID=A0A172T3I3_FERPE|nr:MULTISPECIES: DNA methyltransferase [Fervidobacterium]AFG35767.1 DNA methylase [Fervidobacterium pennivorans DSM 9078]ANE41537.1 DNA methylase N-4 [Fervidobacterium pennivorans]NPU90036.1 methyltransferase domain-containing protein [Fervidobacterium sp.]QIV78640.1 methyltransferase domain-containing protein [Fervidobacterium pennivorans subsp. keratinolyticus]
MHDLNVEFDFKPEITTVWSFPERGKWSTHKGTYRGNFAPQVARNLLLRYTKEGDVILDPMMGSGTTLIEAKLLKRRAIGIDINPTSVELTKRNLSFNCPNSYEPEVFIGDARDLSFIEDETVDFVLLHPPYLNIIKYSEGNINGDLSNISDVKRFCTELEKVIIELFRVLKPGKFCSVLIGDTRKNGHYVPLSYYVLTLFLKNGFVLKEEIIKIQHNCTSTPYWRKKVSENNFYLIMHEHLFVFKKPELGENVSKIKYSAGGFVDLLLKYRYTKNNNG